MDNRNKESKTIENERRIDHLRNIVEKQTRTERHLEEHSDISKSPENIAHAKELQWERENEIENIKDKIVHDGQSKSKQLENTEKRLVYTEGYLNHNASHMDKESFQNAKEKQEHRKEQIDSLR